MVISKSQKLCHLCGALYWDDPFMVETPGHTKEQCLATLRYSFNKCSLELEAVKSRLHRAEKEYGI